MFQNAMFTLGDLWDASAPLLPKEMKTWAIVFLVGILASVCAYFVAKGGEKKS